MFSGIVETTGKIIQLKQDGSNKRFKISCPFLQELKIDQSIAHNGVCLTVEEIEEDGYWVAAIEETLKKTSLDDWKVDDHVNLERSLQLSERIDGHLVQGHVDDVGECLRIEKKDGSWEFTFGYSAKHGNLMVEKGSVSLNGTSLTVFDVEDNTFKVAVIPYTFDHTNIRDVRVGDKVNLEFDVIGKYVAKIMRG